MAKWSRETRLVFGLVVLLVGLQYMAIQHLVLTKETTLFLARQTNHPQLAAAETLEQLTGSVEHVPPLNVNVWQWFGRAVALAGVVLLVRNSGKN
jgi:hypothetical protein